MKLAAEKGWILSALLGFLHWFFGNLYEAIVFSPNWIINSPKQIERLNEFFIHTSPTIYFVPLTQIATIVVWVVYWRNKDKSVDQSLKMASLFALLATILNVIIVASTAIKLFETNYANYGAYLSVLTWRWNVLNMIRMALVASTVYFLFQSYRGLDKME